MFYFLTQRFKQFLYIDPLKQGLKPSVLRATATSVGWFLYIDPLKQGLKLKPMGRVAISKASFYT